MPTKKNGYNPPTITDERMRYVPIGCGNCIECRKQKARSWQVRLTEELKTRRGYFVTLTFREDELDRLQKEFIGADANVIATKAVRRFNERWRKKHGKAIRHWLCTELGHTGTERLHLHGILFTESPEDIEKAWSYGYVYIGQYCNAKTINYVVKYMLKVDTDHKGYQQIILCSAGIGSNYTHTFNAAMNRYRGTNTRQWYALKSGAHINMPIYYRNKIYTESEREELWRDMLDKGRTFVMGKEYRLTTDRGIKEYLAALKSAQRDNAVLGYGDSSDEWKAEKYDALLRTINTN